MGRHKQIESILLQELVADEERSARSVQIINHQRNAIYTLQKELEEFKNGVVPPLNHDDTVATGEYNLIQDQVLKLRASLLELKQMHQNQITSENYFNNPELHETTQAGEIALKRSPHQAFSVADSNPRNVYQPNSDLYNINERLEKTQETEIDLKRKLEILNQKVVWLKQERDEVLHHKQDQLKWRHKVENKLRDLSAGVNEDGDNGRHAEFGDVKSRPQDVWRVARQFFSADESGFLLSATELI